MTGRIEWVLAPLERARVRYLVVGGVAVVLHGYLSRADLMTMKRATGRARDLDDLAALSELSEEDGR